MNYKYFLVLQVYHEEEREKNKILLKMKQQTILKLILFLELHKNSFVDQVYWELLGNSRLYSSNKNLNDIRKMYRNNGTRAIHTVQLTYFCFLKVIGFKIYFEEIHIISKNYLIFVKPANVKYIILSVTLPCISIISILQDL